MRKLPKQLRTETLCSGLSFYVFIFLTCTQRFAVVILKLVGSEKWSCPNVNNAVLEFYDELFSNSQPIINYFDAYLIKYSLPVYSSRNFHALV